MAVGKHLEQLAGARAVRQRRHGHVAGDASSPVADQVRGNQVVVGTAELPVRHVQQIVSTLQGSGQREIAAALAEIPLEGTSGKKLGEVRDGVSLRFSAACLNRIDPQVLQPIVDGKWMVGYDIDSIVSQITSPTLLMQGDEAAGGMLTDLDANRLHQQISDCTLIRFPETGHLIHWTSREALVQHLTGFFEAIR